MTATAAAEYGPTWYAANRSSVPECRMLAGDLDVDVCVVGGGIAGLTVAHALAGRGWSVAVLEAERIGAGGAGGGTGIVAPGFCAPVEEMIERLGAVRARELWSLSTEAVERVRATCAEVSGEPRDANAAPPAGLLVAARADRHALGRKALLLREHLGADAEHWPTTKVGEYLQSRAFHQALHLPQAFSIDPLKYLFDLTAALRSAGVRVYERSPVRVVDPAGIRKHVDTAAGRVRARHVVLAASGDLGALYPPLAGTVMRLSCPVAVTAPLGSALAQAVRFPGAIVGGPAAGSHRIVGGDRLLWSGPLTTRRAAPRRLAQSMGKAIRASYPQLEDVEVEYAWHTQADYAVHRMPQIGQLAPGLWLAAAFTHHGIAAAAMAGEVIARAIIDNDDQWRIFQSYGLVWTGGLAGRAVVGGMLRLTQLGAAVIQRSASSGIPAPPHEATVPPSEENTAAPSAEAVSFAPDEASSPVPQAEGPPKQRTKPRAAGPGGKRRRKLRLRTRKLAKRPAQAPTDSPPVVLKKAASTKQRAKPRSAEGKRKRKRKSAKRARAERAAGTARV